MAHGLYSAGSAVVAHGFVTPQHVGSSQTRARTHVPCIGRWILNHCATREVPVVRFACWDPDRGGGGWGAGVRGRSAMGYRNMPKALLDPGLRHHY